MASVMALDVALLTALLYLSGGALNPFSFLYLVQIALAAVLLHAGWTWTLVALSLGSFGLLLIDHRALVLPNVRVHQQGMWVALGVASAFIVHFLLRITAALAQREHELADARNLAARQERLASLATMAAGAAHELSTPLGTIALVAKEIERTVERGRAGGALVDLEPLVEDLRLIREQVGRCRVILDQMAAGGGESAGEAVEQVSVAQLLDEALSSVRPAPPVRRVVQPSAAEATVRLPPGAVAQALRSLITNAQDASGSDSEVVVAVQLVGQGSPVLRLEVRDRGPGMSPDVIERVGEPFFTTKAPGRGMGLGLFLARAVVEGLGGTLTIDSRLGRGTTVAVTLPVDVRARSATPAPRESGI
jgi:two-component system sensor histidine kinase RegB